MTTDILKTRDKLILKILDGMLKLHNKFYTKKRANWQIKREELLEMPVGSLGQELGRFLLKENFHSIPMLERHDVFHLLFGFDTHTKDEIAMLCFLVGNGKTTPFTTLSAIGAVMVYPEHLLYFMRHFIRGTNAINVSNWDFRPFLSENIHELREAIFLRQVPHSSVKLKMKKQLLKTSYHGNHQS